MSLPNRAPICAAILAGACLIGGCMSPLSRAAGEGDAQRVSALLAGGADVNGAGGDGIPLVEAAAYGRADVVKILLAAGADPTRAERSVGNALDVATSTGHPEIAKLIRRALEKENGRVQPPVEEEAAPPAAAPEQRAAPSAKTWWEK